MARHDTDIDFCTLGMFIIDDIEFRDRPTVKDALGGAGSYSAVGARIFSPPPRSGAVGWIVDCGSDFPPELRDTIAQWDTACLMRETPERLTTRGWNGYGENEHRAFRYMTPKLRLDHHALADTPLLWSKSFHLICSPTRCIDLVEQILALRGQDPKVGVNSLPLFIWEPVPDLCTAQELANCYQALKYVDVVSPNHSELGAFFAKDTNGKEHVDFRLIETLCHQWLESGIGSDRSGAVVVRAGKDGCYVARQTSKRWIPAYHQSADKVVDPTGGGNGYLGGLAMGLVRGGDAPGLQNIEEAAIWGSIAASFTIEQVGMPVLHHSSESGGETWNGVRVEKRLLDFKLRLDQYTQP